MLAYPISVRYMFKPIKKNTGKNKTSLNEEGDIKLDEFCSLSNWWELDVYLFKFFVWNFIGKELVECMENVILKNHQFLNIFIFFERWHHFKSKYFKKNMRLKYFVSFAVHHLQSQILLFITGNISKYRVLDYFFFVLRSYFGYPFRDDVRWFAVDLRCILHRTCLEIIDNKFQNEMNNRWSEFCYRVMQYIMHSNFHGLPISLPFVAADVCYFLHKVFINLNYYTSGMIRRNQFQEVFYRHALPRSPALSGCAHYFYIICEVHSNDWLWNIVHTWMREFSI